MRRRIAAAVLAAATWGCDAVTVPAAALEAGAGARWLHVLAGPDDPFAEHIIALE